MSFRSSFVASQGKLSSLLNTFRGAAYVTFSLQESNPNHRPIRRQAICSAVQIRNIMFAKMPCNMVAVVGELLV